MTDDTLPTPNSSSAGPVKPAESMLEVLMRLAKTPVGNLIRGHSSGPFDAKAAIAAANLPAELASLIGSVVQQTRLWRRERLDVARELISHFADGLHAGASAAELRDRFGDPRQTAQMIRRARLRSRPAWWFAWRYALTGMAVLLLMYVGLAVKYFTSRPTIARDYLREINEPISKTPVDQRAWPLYQEALAMRRPYPRPDLGIPDELGEGWWQSETNRVDHNSDAWKQLETFVDQNRASLELIHQATRRPIRGKAYEERADGTPLDHQKDTLISVNLLPISELRTIAQLLGADARVAAAQNDGNRVTEDLRSLIKLADHAHGTFLIEDLISTAILQLATVTIRDTLEDSPQLLTDQQWIGVAHQLAVFRGGGTIRFDLHGEQMVLDDVLQRTYTDDGHGRGSFTPAGLQFLKEIAAPISKAKDQNQSTDPREKAIELIAGPATPYLALSRQEAKATTDRLFAQSLATRRGPMFTWVEPSPVDNYFCETAKSLNPMARMSLPMFLFPALQQSDTAAERLCQVRDGTLTAIALHLYHRSEGTWPMTLDQLVPRYLPELPLDRFTGQPLCYQVRNNVPLVYARGADEQDDNGRTPDTDVGNAYLKTYVKPQIAPAPGEGYDLVLFPRPRRVPNGP